MIPIGQYLQTTSHPFTELAAAGMDMAFHPIASGLLVRFSCLTDQRAHAAGPVEETA